MRNPDELQPDDDTIDEQAMDQTVSDAPKSDEEMLDEVMRKMGFNPDDDDEETRRKWDKEGKKMVEEEKKKDAKEIVWQRNSEEVGKIPHIENGSKNIVTALNVSEIPTSQSCEGHINGAEITKPFVEISAPNQPEKRFVGQEKIIPKVAEKYGMTQEDVRTMLLHSAPWEEFDGAEETQDYKKWMEKTKKIAKRVEGLLKGFYGDIVPDDVGLTVKRQDAGQFEITNIGNGQDVLKDKTELEGRLSEYQSEMDKFAQFLKAKYFTN